MRLWKQNDTTKVILFYMVDSTDHVTEETGLTLTVTVSKNGGAFGAVSGTVAEVANGVYKLTPVAGDVDTLGPAVFRATATGADSFNVEGRVVSFDPYDAAGLGLSRVDAAISSRNAIAPATPTNVTDAQAAIIGEVNANETKIDTAQTSLTLLEGRLTAARAGYLDNLNVGGPVASNADILAINQSASRRVLLATVGQFERPESGSTTYTIEARLYDPDGAAVNDDATPSLTGTGATSGSLAANIAAPTNPATGVYRWAYTQSSAAVLEPIRFDLAALIGGSTFTMAVHTQSVDFVSATWTTQDQSNLTSIFNKLPSRNYLAGATASTGALVDTDTVALSAAALAAVNAEADIALTDYGAAQPGDAMDLISSAIQESTISSGAFTAAKFAASSLNGKGDWNIGKTGYTLIQAFPANFAALGISGGGDISRVTLVDTTTLNSDMRGTDGANTVVPLGAVASQSEHDATQALIGALNNISTADLISALTTDLTEGYRATGQIGSVRDLLYEIIAHLGNSDIAGITKTIKKLDKVTNAKTFTLDSAITPTAIEETT